MRPYEAVRWRSKCNIYPPTHTHTHTMQKQTVGVCVRIVRGQSTILTVRETGIRVGLLQFFPEKKQIQKAKRWLDETAVRYETTASARLLRQ